ncbi:MAG TPA: DUF2087 domain-containing protein [Ktedonobacteraceae bacterium]|nr:DUF2087 domain-containing protein [Ktedonobacteraceae bacterium]
MIEEDKVFRDFFDGPRLKEIPANHKRRMVILKWLANQFEPGVIYKEAQVNAIIARHHPDFAYFRRSMVDSGLMRRESRKGIYWRVS